MQRIDEIVVDVETQKLFKEVPGGRDSLDLLGVGCAVVYSYVDDSYAIYKADSVNELKERLLSADRVTGFNTWNFDYPVIWGMKRDVWLKSPEAARLLPKSNDLLRRIWISQGLSPDVFTKLHKGVSLGVLAEATLGQEKSGVSTDAPALLSNGQWDLLASYCLYDVKLTKELNDFVDKFGYVLDGTDKVIRVWAKADEVV